MENAGRGINSLQDKKSTTTNDGSERVLAINQEDQMTTCPRARLQGQPKSSSNSHIIWLTVSTGSTWFQHLCP